MKAIVGSHNYNLNTDTSDKDYKYFVLPTFDELYCGKFFSRAKQLEQDFKSQKPNENLLNVLNDTIKSFLYQQIQKGNIVP